MRTGRGRSSGGRLLITDLWETTGQSRRADRLRRCVVACSDDRGPCTEGVCCVATVVLGAVATGALIAPVAFHRFLTGHGMKPELVHVASRLIAVGLITLALTIAAALLLLLRTATGNPAAAWGLSAACLIWFATSWLVLPQVVLRRTAAARRAAVSGLGAPRGGGRPPQ
ncbi:DUF6328 family protein [Kitasatospora sp. NPDC001119]|uniref:DUF6328 family protein n=1 Tax=Kitasatospora TaxID=2063 RepID=UPI001C7013F2|nr:MULTISPECIES: DUF6328 family protein [Kitasatospora]